MADRLENSSFISAVETEDIHDSSDIKLEGVMYFSGGIPRESESPPGRDRENIRSLFGIDGAYSRNDKNIHPGYAANESATGYYYKAHSDGSGLGTSSSTQRSKPNVDTNTSQPFYRSSSDGMGSRFHIPRHKSIPPPPPPGRKKSYCAPTPPVRQQVIRDDIFASMIDQAERLSSNRSINTPSVLETPHDEQYWLSVRGNAKSRSQMKGKGHSAKTKRDPIDSSDIGGDPDTTKDARLLASQRRKIEHEKRKQMRSAEKLISSCPSLHSSTDPYDSGGEDFGTGASQGSRLRKSSNVSKSRQIVANRTIKLEYEKGEKFIQMHQKKKHLNQRSRSLDRHDSRHQSRPHNRKEKQAQGVSMMKKTGIFVLLKGKKERYANESDMINKKLSIQSMFDTMSVGSSRSGRSKNSRKSCRSANSRRTQDSKYSRNSKRSLRSFRKANEDSRSKNDIDTNSGTNSAGSGHIPNLSAEADLFQQQHIPGKMSEPIQFDGAMSCSSSLSVYSDEDLDSDTSSVLIMASVAEAVEHLNSQNKIEKFVSKVKNLI